MTPSPGDLTGLVHRARQAMDDPLKVLEEGPSAPPADRAAAVEALASLLGERLPRDLEEAEAALQEATVAELPDALGPREDPSGFRRQLLALEEATEGVARPEVVWAWAKRGLDRAVERARERLPGMRAVVAVAGEDSGEAWLDHERARARLADALQQVAWALDDLLLAQRDLALARDLDAPTALGRDPGPAEVLVAARRARHLGSPEARRFAREAIGGSLRHALAEVDRGLPPGTLAEAARRAEVPLPGGREVVADALGLLDDASPGRLLASRLLTDALLEVAEAVAEEAGRFELDADARLRLSGEMGGLERSP